MGGIRQRNNRDAKFEDPKSNSSGNKQKKSFSSIATRCSKSIIAIVILQRLLATPVWDGQLPSYTQETTTTIKPTNLPSLVDRSNQTIALHVSNSSSSQVNLTKLPITQTNPIPITRQQNAFTNSSRKSSQNRETRQTLIVDKLCTSIPVLPKPRLPQFSNSWRIIKHIWRKTTLFSSVRHRRTNVTTVDFPILPIASCMSNMPKRVIQTVPLSWCNNSTNTFEWVSMLRSAMRSLGPCSQLPNTKKHHKRAKEALVAFFNTFLRRNNWEIRSLIGYRSYFDFVKSQFS